MSSILPLSERLAPLADWFTRQGRQLPWRDTDLGRRHPDPYGVLVSELMLQQTQVATVIPYFQRWMATFPDPETLARASDEQVHACWEGLGYYRRARFLKQAATIIARSGWPQDLQGLLALPGLGPYTAAAVASIAFQLPEPALDGNAFRVLARIEGTPDDPKGHAEAWREALRPLLAGQGPSRITQALMELGATVCLPRPACGACPVQEHCQAFRLGLTQQIPAPKARPHVKTLDLWLVATHAAGHWLLLPPRTEGLLAGLWRWPSVEAQTLTTPPTDIAPAPPEATLQTWKGWTQVYTHRREHIIPLAIHLPTLPSTSPEGAWVEEARLASLPMGKRDQRLRALLPEPGSAPNPVAPLPEVIRRVLAEPA